MKITAQHLKEKKPKNEKIVCITVYDYTSAKLLDETDVDLVLVGDSLGMMMLGYPDTTHVVMEDILHHTRAVARGVKRVMIVADLPIHSYNTPEEALKNSHRLIEAGADGVKLEGGKACKDQIEAIVQAGIPFMGHLGMLPQHIVEEGGKYRLKGKTEEEAQFLMDEMRVVEDAGAFSVVLELVKSEIAEKISRTFSIPTIGIGSGKNCDGQIQVFHDVVGSYPWFKPKHSFDAGNVALEISKAVQAYAQHVRGESQ